MLFRDPKDEDRLCQVLHAYVAEWGPENVIVSVPAHWSSFSNSTLGLVRLKFETEQRVAIRVEYDNKVILRFEVPVEPEVSSSEKVRIPTGESLETRLFRVALKYLAKHGGLLREDAVSNVMSVYIGTPKAAVPLHEFELKFGHAEPSEIAYFMIQHLIAKGLISDLHTKTHMLRLTERGLRWLILDRSRR